MMVRRAVALGVGLVLLILIVVGIKSCLNTRQQDALRTYNDNVSTIVRESSRKVARPLFAALANAAGKSPIQVQTTINDLHITALDEASRAKGLSTPSPATGAERDLLLALNLRAEAIGKIADNVRSAFLPRGSAAGVAVSRIAGEMELFLASDVVYVQRIAPLIRQALLDNSVGGQFVVTSRFLPDLGWLDAATVASRLGSGTAVRRGPVTPGSHGHALTSVSVGSTTLSATPVVNRLTGASNPTFTVTITNQGSNNETGVKVDIAVTASGQRQLSATKTIDQTKAGSTATVAIPLGAPAPTGVPVHIEAAVEPVPGEKVVSNNKQTYSAIFTR